MSDNGKKPPRPLFPAAVPVIGQPFTLLGVGIPVNAKLRCNCGGEHVTVEIAGSVAMACPSCRRVFNIVFNPTTSKLEAQIALPSVEQVLS